MNMIEIIAGKDWLSNMLCYHSSRNTYLFGDVIIRLDDSNINVDYELCKWYDDTAKAMGGGYEERRKQLKRLIKAFIEDVSTQKEGKEND